MSRMLHIAFLLASLLMGGQVLAQQTAPAQQEEDIRDIRSPIPIPDPRIWLAYAAGVLSAGGLCYGLYRLLRRRLRQRPVLPYDLAMQRLDQARRLMVPDKGKEFSIAVSEAVREYIEQRFGARAAHRTTEEFLHNLLGEKDSPLVAHREVLSEFLNDCDLAKFARFFLSGDAMETLFQSARTFVQRTRPEGGQR